MNSCMLVLLAFFSQHEYEGIELGWILDKGERVYTFYTYTEAESKERYVNYIAIGVDGNSKLQKTSDCKLSDGTIVDVKNFKIKESEIYKE